MDAKELATKLDMENLKIGCKVQVRRRCIKTQFDSEKRDESIDDPEMRYKVDFYFKVLNITIIMIIERF